MKKKEKNLEKLIKIIQGAKEARCCFCRKKFLSFKTTGEYPDFCNKCINDVVHNKGMKKKIKYYEFYPK